MYKFWMYYLGSPNNVGQDSPLAMATLKMSGCVSPLAMQDKAKKYSLPREETLTNG